MIRIINIKQTLQSAFFVLFLSWMSGNNIESQDIPSIWESYLCAIEKIASKYDGLNMVEIDSDFSRNISYFDELSLGDLVRRMGINILNCRNSNFSVQEKIEIEGNINLIRYWIGLRAPDEQGRLLNSLIKLEKGLFGGSVLEIK